jgi:aminopeptidase N
MYNARKVGGYSADQMSTTHAISQRVQNTDAADQVFDEITYNKGGAALRQLFALLGTEAFRGGLFSYFKEFAFKNATLDDLVRHLQYAHAQRGGTIDLQAWKDEWLLKAGLNSVEAVFVTSEDT